MLVGAQHLCLQSHMVGQQGIGRIYHANHLHTGRTDRRKKCGPIR
jgi:hypothetical protein